MKEKNRLIVLFAVIFLALFGFLYVLYQDSREHPRWGPPCPCEMVKNRECSP